jgi:hypothetical protein
LDRRNRDLVWLGEDVLREIEKSDLFGRSGESSNVKDEKQLSGILWRQARSEEAWASRRFPIVYIRDAWLGKHRVWLKLIAVLIGVSFLAGAVYVYGNWAKIAERSTTSSIAPAKSGAVTPPAPAK